MKRFLFIFLLVLCGCSNKVNLNCSYVDNSSIFGNKSIIDTFSFKNNHIISYERSIDYSVNNDIRSVYKIVKLEGKALKKYIGGKYSMNKNNSSVVLVFNSKNVDNLKYIGIDNNYGYDEVISVYSGLGFDCQ